MSIRISISGPGDISKHLEILGTMDKDEFYKHLNGLASVISVYPVDLVVMPGIGVELAKRVKMMGNVKIYLPIPIEDKLFGVKHIQKHLNTLVGANPLFDGVINTINWYRTDDVRLILGDIGLILGYSLGSIREFAGGLYLYRILQKKKRGVEVQREDMGKDIKAGRMFPFEVWVYKPFTSGRLPKEIEGYCKSIETNVVYIKSPDDLKKNLERVLKIMRTE